MYTSIITEFLNPLKIMHVNNSHFIWTSLRHLKSFQHYLWKVHMGNIL